MKRSASAILLSLFLGCLAYQFFLYYKPYIPAVNVDSMGIWIVIITCSLAPILAALLSVASRPKPTRRRQNQPTAKLPKLTQQEEKLCRQLIGLLNGDQDAAQWLIYQSNQTNPNRDVMWHLDKVIVDLKRDRALRPNAPLPQAPPRRQQPIPQPQRAAAKFSKNEERAYRELVHLLHGDADQAERLFRGSLETNPGRGVMWNIDKLTLDLVRDRGGRPAPKRDYRDYRDC